MPRPRVDTEVVLRAAAELIADSGVRAATMDAIATRAGVAKGVLYLRYPSKEKLLAAVVDREVVLATRCTVDLIEADPRGGMLSRLFVHSLSALHSRPALLRLYREDGLRAARTANWDSAARHHTTTVLGEEFIRELQQVGLVHPDLDADALSTNLMLWNYGLAVQAPHADLGRLILGMRDVVSRAADTDVADSSPGKRCFSRLAEQIIETRTAPVTSQPGGPKA